VEIQVQSGTFSVILDRKETGIWKLIQTPDAELLQVFNLGKTALLFSLYMRTMIGQSWRAGSHPRAGGTCSSTAGEARKKHSLFQPKQTIGGPGLTQGALTDVPPHSRFEVLLFFFLLFRQHSSNGYGKTCELRFVQRKHRRSRWTETSYGRPSGALVGRQSRQTPLPIASALCGTSAESSMGERQERRSRLDQGKNTPILRTVNTITRLGYGISGLLTPGMINIKFI
jgi:hypothetical protein